MQNDEAHYTRAIYTALRIGFVAFVLYWSFLIVRPFVLLVIWSIIISIAVYPLYKKLTNKLGGRHKLGATLIIIAGLTIFLVPSVMMFDSVIESIGDIATQLESGTLKIPPPKDKVADWPVVGHSIYDVWELASVSIKDAAENFQPQIKEFAPKVLSLASHLVVTLLLFFASFIIAGIFLVYAKESKRAAQSVFDTLVGEDQGRNFTGIAVATIKSVVNGIIGIAATQSLLAALGMFAIGIPAAGLWALIVFFLAIVQLPPILIMAPIAVYSFSIVDTTPAVVFSIFSIIVSVSDAILKPIFLGRGVNVPMPAVLLGAIGGVILYGMIGLFVGAVVLAITYKVITALLVEDVLDKNLEEDESQNGAGALQKGT